MNQLGNNTDKQASTRRYKLVDFNMFRHLRGLEYSEDIFQCLEHMS